MHRIRTWARAKAHGPSPLSSAGATRRGSVPGRGEPSLHRRFSSATTDVAPEDARRDEQLERSPSQGQLAKDRSIISRFFSAITDILLSSWMNVLLVFVPVGIAVHFTQMPAGVVFGLNAIAIVPLAGLLSHATESVASRCGDTVAALMNVTFGNAVELIIFIMALVKDQVRIVQLSLVGSVLCNLLLILGMSFIVGGLRYREQIYNSTVTQMSACLLSLSVISLLLPTVFHATFNSVATANHEVLQVSRGTSVVLMMVYFLYLFFQLKSHSFVYVPTPQHVIERETVPGLAAQYFHSSSTRGSSLEHGDDSRSQPVAPRTRAEGTNNEASGTSPDDHAAQGISAGDSSTDIEPPIEMAELELQDVASKKNNDNDNDANKGHGQMAHDRSAFSNHDSHCPPRCTDFALASHTEEARGEAPRNSEMHDDDVHEEPTTSRRTAILLLVASTGLVALCAEFMVDSIDDIVADENSEPGSGGISEAFIGLILLPIVGNAAEHITAVTVAFKNKMDLAMGVALGSSIQIALFVTPFMVILGWAMGKDDMSLFFSLFETICIFVSTFIVNFLVLDGRSNYLEGALLLASYIIIAVAAFFSPNMNAASSLGEGE